jgi:hypothetical protein
MRASGVRGLLIYCADYKCSHSISMIADQWPDASGCQTSKASSFARRAVSAVPMSGRILVGTRSRFGGPAFVEKRHQRGSMHLPLPRHHHRQHPTKHHIDLLRAEPLPRSDPVQFTMHLMQDGV